MVLPVCHFCLDFANRATKMQPGSLFKTDRHFNVPVRIVGAIMDRTTTLANAASATAVTVAGMATGLYYEVLLAGFAGALISLSFIEGMGIWRRLWSLFTSSIFSGYTAPVVAAYLANVVPGDDLAILLFSGLLMGMGAQVLIPVGISWMKKKAVSFQGL